MGFAYEDPYEDPGWVRGLEHRGRRSWHFGEQAGNRGENGVATVETAGEHLHDGTDGRSRVGAGPGGARTGRARVPSLPAAAVRIKSHADV
jgi:hypothetical protein